MPTTRCIGSLPALLKPGGTEGTLMDDRLSRGVAMSAQQSRGALEYPRTPEAAIAELADATSATLLSLPDDHELRGPLLTMRRALLGWVGQRHLACAAWPLAGLLPLLLG